MPHGDEARGHGDWVGGKGSGVGEDDLVGKGIHHVHHLSSAANGTHGKATADGLAECGQVGDFPVPFLGATKSASEGDHLVCHKQSAVGQGPFAHGGHKVLVRWPQSHPMGQEVKQHAGDLGLVAFEQSDRAFGIVEGQDDDFGQGRGGCALGHGHAGGSCWVAPVAGACGLADFRVVVLAVIGTLDLGNLGASSERAGGFQATHHRLGPGIHKAHLFKGRVAAAEVLGEFHFHLGAHGESRAPLELFRHRVDHRSKTMAVDQRCHVVGKVDALDSFHVGHAAARGAHRIGRMGMPKNRVAADATGHHLLGSLV